MIFAFLTDNLNSWQCSFYAFGYHDFPINPFSYSCVLSTRGFTVATRHFRHRIWSFTFHLAGFSIQFHPGFTFWTDW
ncbi:uncharacterized protein METZ01_LOCUS145467 [marine metagenome]|uniref:Uncharacterized protein n=1 Tax=marine metagenome TaxID=408172 RepID=A0A381ZV39_9ZZZZ